MQGNNKILCTFLCLHSLTAVIGCQAFEVLRNPLEVMAFPLKHRTCLPCGAISLLPQVVPFLRGAYCLPLFCPNFICLKFFWILSRLSCCMAFKAPTDTWSFWTTCLGLWTPDCSQATLECISHQPQAFVVLLFQSISQTTSLVRRRTTPPPKLLWIKYFRSAF